MLPLACFLLPAAAALSPPLIPQLLRLCVAAMHLVTHCRCPPSLCPNAMLLPLVAPLRSFHDVRCPLMETEDEEEARSQASQASLFRLYIVNKLALSGGDSGIVQGQTTNSLVSASKPLCLVALAPLAAAAAAAAEAGWALGISERWRHSGCK